MRVRFRELESLYTFEPVANDFSTTFQSSPFALSRYSKAVFGATSPSENWILDAIIERKAARSRLRTAARKAFQNEYQFSVIAIEDNLLLFLGDTDWRSSLITRVAYTNV